MPRLCKAHFGPEFTWRHLNFFQHHCYIGQGAPHGLPRHGVKRIQVMGARGQGLRSCSASGGDPGARDAVLAGSSASPISVCGASRARASARLDLGRLKAVGLDETASKRGHNYVVSLMPSKSRWSLSARQGKATVAAFKAPGATWRHAGPHRRGGLRHVSGLPGGHGETFAGQRDGRLVPCRPELFTKAVDEVQGRSGSTTPCPRRYAGLRDDSAQ